MRRTVSLILLPLLFLIVAFSTVGVMSYLGDQAFKDWHLVFLGWDRTTRLVGLTVTCALVVGCIGLLFRYEQRLVSQRLGWTLLILRMLAILTLFLTLLEPVWSWSIEEEHKGRVLVALDLSESMDTKDLFATEAEKLRWARGLGMIGNAQNAERVEQWIAAYEAGKEPEWVAPDEANDAGKRQQLTQVRKQNLEAVFQQVQQLSRKEILKRLILSEPNPLKEKLEGLVEAEFCLFAGEFENSPEPQLAELIDQPSPGIVPGHTDITKPLAAAAGGDADVPLVGIVVLSDGRDNVHASPQQFAARLTGSAVPVHTVLIGSERRPKDLAVVNVDAPEKVFQDDHPVVRVTLRTSGFAGEKLAVTLEEVDQPAFKPLVEEVIPTGDVVDVVFKLDDVQEGRHRFRLSTPVRKEEIRDDNNDREFALEVVDDHADVLVLEGEGRWEFRYLDAALRRDERVKLETVLFDQPYLGVLPNTFYPRTLGTLAGVVGANEPTPYSRFDAVLIGDVSMQHLNQQTWLLLDKYVREEGGTMIMLAGKQSFPRRNSFDIVKDLLPVENIREINLTDGLQVAPPDRRGFRLELTPDGAILPMFQFDADPIKNESIWSTLPGHTWGLVGEAKKTATVWATLPPREGEDTGLAGERKRTLVAQQYVGTGQVVWIGVDSTWRWRFRAGDQYHHRFWGQLVRWAVDFKASSGNAFVRFGVSKPVAATGEQVVFKAQWDERFLRQHPGVKAQAVLTKRNGGEQPITVDLVPQEGRNFVFEGRHTPLTDGDYIVRLQVQGAPLDDVIETEFTVTNTLSPELQDVSANRDLLEQAAALTGGRFFLPDQLGELPDLFQDVHQVKSLHEEIPIWDHWLVLILFCLFATSEWILRKINGLP